MAGTKVNGYGVGDVNLTCLMATVDAQRKGFFGLSLTEFDTDDEPAIAAGSVIEVNGALYKFDSEEAISGSPSDGTVYVMVVPSGDSITAQFTNTAPTWSDSKQGWYDSTGNYRYVARMTLDSGSYYNKSRYIVADMMRSEGSGGYLRYTTIDIGDWDMDTTISVWVYHKLDYTKIRTILSVIIRSDSGALLPLDYAYDFDNVHGQYTIPLTPGTVVALGRKTGGVFDSSSFSATPYNRGWITIGYIE